MDARRKQWLRDKVWMCNSIDEIKYVLDDIISELPVEPEYDEDLERELSNIANEK